MRKHFIKLSTTLTAALFIFAAIPACASSELVAAENYETEYKSENENKDKDLYESKDTLNEFEILLQFALNRLARAAEPSENITTGRHNADDILAFEQAIHTAETIEDLNAAITAFFNATIDPYNRYAPYLSTIAIGEDIPQIRHLRAAWISTVINIDWPSNQARGTTPQHVDMQKAELRQRFDEMAALKMNAVIFQISPTADAMFNSSIVPWSAWLTGETNFAGELLDSNGNAFDPLEYAIQLARERNMELHAWFNPYRITHALISYTRGDGIILSSTGQVVSSLQEIRNELNLIEGNPFNIMGDFIRIGENRYVLDPGVPAARQWIIARVMEVVNNYDIDAIHFDDYFYPSGWNDDAVFAMFGNNFPDTQEGRANWRRQNTETLIIEVNKAIKAAKPWVRFGISPGGVWISGDGSTGLDRGGWEQGYTGSASTTTWSNFHSSFADTRHWVIENKIDYITPQIYWDWSLPAAPYGAIADWWSRLVFDYGPQGEKRNSQGKYTTTHLYIGLGLYRLFENPAPKWRNLEGYGYEGVRTFLRQEHYNLGNPNIQGSMIFSQNHTRPNRTHGMWEAMSHLAKNAWRYYALVPAFNHLGGTTPQAPTDITIENGYLTWSNPDFEADELTRPRYFIIYASTNINIDIKISNPANILAIVPSWDNSQYKFKLPENLADNMYFIVTAVNRLHQESMPKITIRHCKE